MARFAVFLDLSGTLFVDEVAIPGAVVAVQKLLANPLFAVRFVTNTTKESSENLMKRLHRTGFTFVQKDAVFTSLTAARRLVENQKLRPFLLLEPEAIGEFEGIPTSDPTAVVIGLAPSEFHYAKLNEAFRLLHANPHATLIGIHKGRVYERKDGLALGPGPFVAALEYATGKNAIVVGKPEANFFNGASQTLDTDIPLSRTVMIGDDVRDDVLGALRAGLKAMLVRTGKFRAGDESLVDFKAPVVENVAFAIDMLLSDNGATFFGTL